MEKTTKIEHELKLTMNSFLGASMKASQMSKDLNEGSKRVASLYKAVDELNDKLNSAVERADGLGQSFQRYRSACEAESRDLRSQVRKLKDTANTLKHMEFMLIDHYIDRARRALEERRAAREQRSAT